MPAVKANAAAKATPCKLALAKWLAGPGAGMEAGMAEKVELTGICPPIEKMDSSLAALRACRHLALSTNNIDKIGSLGGLESLQILSLGRNCLKKLENLEAVAGTLHELWLSYNQIDRLVRGQSCLLATTNAVPACCIYMLARSSAGRD
jgi:dynein light chain 1